MSQSNMSQSNLPNPNVPESQECSFAPGDDSGVAKSRRKLGLQLHLHELGTFDEFGLPHRGIRVRRVIPNEAGYWAGVRDGDMILEIDNIPVQNLKGMTPDLLEAFTSFVRSTAIGDVIQILIKREDQNHLIKIML